MATDPSAALQYRIVRSSAKISELPNITVIDDGAKFLVAYQNKNYSIEMGVIKTVIANAVLAMGGGTNTFDPLLLPISTATQAALNQKANISHTHTVAEVQGLAQYVTDAINAALAAMGGSTIVHTHPMTDVVGLVDALGLKANANQIPPILQSISDLTTSKADLTVVTAIQQNIATLNSLIAQKASQADLTALTAVVNALIITVNGKANAVHTHEISDINLLSAELASFSTAIAAANAQITNLSTALAAETSARTAADTGLDQRVTSIEAQLATFVVSGTTSW